MVIMSLVAAYRSPGVETLCPMRQGPGLACFPSPRGAAWAELAGQQDKRKLNLFFFFCLFSAAPVALGSSQARGRIRATSAATATLDP